MKRNDLIRQTGLLLDVLKHFDGNPPDLPVFCLVLKRCPPQHYASPDGPPLTDVLPFRVRKYQPILSGKIFSVKLRGQKRIGGGDDLHGLIQFSRHRLISLRHPEVKRTGIKPGNHTELTVT